MVDVSNIDVLPSLRDVKPDIPDPEKLRLETQSSYTPLEQSFVSSTDDSPAGGYYDISELTTKAALGDREAIYKLCTPLAMQHGGLSEEQIKIKREQIKGFKGTSFAKILSVRSLLGVNKLNKSIRILLGDENFKWRIRIENQNNDIPLDSEKGLDLLEPAQNVDSKYPGMHLSLGKIEKAQEENGTTYYYRQLSMASTPSKQAELKAA